MSIAELIMTGTNRASDSTAWVGDSLAKLGQNVGQALAQREQQKQAQEMLPFLQQSMQESMSLAGSGKTGEAYAKLIPFLADTSVARNPFMMPALEAGIKMNQIAADDFLRKSQIDAYNARYGGGTGGGGGGFDSQSFLNALNQSGGEVLEVDETVNPEGVNPVVAGRMPGFRIPAEGIQTQRGMSMTPKSITAQASTTGLPAVTPTAIPQTKDAVDAEAANNLPKNKPPAPIARGPVDLTNPANALFPDLQITEPPKNVLEKFIRFEDKFAALPFEKQKAEMDNNSIIFPNKEMLASYKPAKGRGIIELSPAAAVGVPGLAGGVEVPESYMKYIVGSINVNPSTGVKSYSIKPEIEGDAKAKAALNWFNQWQDTSIQVNSNPQLRDLLSKAGNDALAIDVVPIGKGDMPGQAGMAELSVKGKPETKIQVPKVAADQITILQTQTAAANTHDAKFIRLKGEEPEAKVPAPTPSGLPATQPQPAAAIPEEAMALQKIVEQGQAAKAGETAKNVEKRIQDIDAQIKRLGSPTIERGGRLASEGNIPARSKTSEEAQADIQKITQLKAQRQLLFAKTEKAYNAAKSEGRVFQNADEVKSSKKKFPAGTIIYIGREPAKVK
jgi:hypothetical protein